MTSDRVTMEPVPRRVVDAARLGDEAAWREIFDRQYVRLYRFFRSRVSGAEQAEDLAADVLLEAFRSIARFEWQGKPFEAWLFAIARHRLASHYRTRGPETGAVLEHVHAHDDFIAVEVRDLLERLRPEHRVALELRFIVGLSGLEAAAAMDRSHGSFRALLARAMRAFRRESARGDVRAPSPRRRNLYATALPQAGRGTAANDAAR